MAGEREKSAATSELSTKERVARLEVLVNNVTADGSVNLVQKTNELHGEVTILENRIKTLTSDFAESVATWRDGMQNVKDEVNILRKAVAGSSGSNTEGATTSNVRVPEPKAFDGSRSAKELENFLWDMEQYFTAAHIPERERVTITSMYLIGDAKLWWRTRTDLVTEDGRPSVASWEALKSELKEQFLPSNSVWIAREALKKCKQTGSVRDYVKEYSSIMLDIRDMSDSDKLFNFISGLQQWVQLELRRSTAWAVCSLIYALWATCNCHVCI